MKQIICIYSEGLEHKLAILGKEKDKISINQVFTINANANLAVDNTESLGDFTDDSLMSEDISFDELDSMDPMGAIEEDSAIDSTDISQIAAKLVNCDLSKTQFIPVITDPNVTFHIYEGPLDKDKKKTLDKIILEIQNTKGLVISRDQIDFISLDETTHLCVFTEPDVPCANLVNSIAAYNGKKYYKIYSIKSAEIALANFVSKTTKFFPEDYSLIIYIGKEYSKLIFLEGQNLKHIGATLDIGLQNLHTYDVYFSKILLEMENGGIPRLDNVVICGDDRSENLVLSFYGTFPEANVSEL